MHCNHSVIIMSLISQSCSDFVYAEAVVMVVSLARPTGLYREGLLHTQIGSIISCLINSPEHSHKHLGR